MSEDYETMHEDYETMCEDYETMSDYETMIKGSWSSFIYNGLADLLGHDGKPYLK